MWEELDYDDELMSTLEAMREQQEVDFGIPYMQCTGRGRVNFPTLFSVIANAPAAAKMGRAQAGGAVPKQAVRRRVGKGRAQLLRERQKQRQLGMVEEVSSPSTPGSSDLNSVRSAPVANDRVPPIPKMQDIAGALVREREGLVREREGSNASIPQSCQSLPITHPAPPPARSRSLSQPRGRGRRNDLNRSESGSASAKSAKRDTSEPVSFSFSAPKQKLTLPKDTVVTDEDYVQLGKSKAAMWLQSDFKHVEKVLPSNHPKSLKEHYKRDRANINQESLDRLLQASANFTARSDGDASSGRGKGKYAEWPKMTSSVEVTVSETFPSLGSSDIVESGPDVVVEDDDLDGHSPDAHSPEVSPCNSPPPPKHIPPIGIQEFYDNLGQNMQAWGEESESSSGEKQQESQSVAQGDSKQGESAPTVNAVEQECKKDTEVDDFAKRKNSRRRKEGRELKAALASSSQTVSNKMKSKTAGKKTPPEMDNALDAWHKVVKSQSPPKQFRAQSQSVGGPGGNGSRDQFDDASSPSPPEGLNLFIDLDGCTNTGGSTPMPELEEDFSTHEVSAVSGVGFLPPESSASDTSTFRKFNEMSLPRAALSKLKQRGSADGDAMNPAVTSPQQVVGATGDGAASGGVGKVEIMAETTGTVNDDKGRNLPVADDFQDAEDDVEQKEANNGDEEETEPPGTVVVRNIPTNNENKERIYDIALSFGAIDSYETQEMEFDMLEVKVKYKKMSSALLMVDCLNGQDGLFLDYTLQAELCA